MQGVDLPDAVVKHVAAMANRTPSIGPLRRREGRMGACPWTPCWPNGTSTASKVHVILHYLRDQQWLKTNGAIIFSQYRTTAEWVLESLCDAFPNEPVALYAGGGVIRPARPNTNPAVA